MYVDAHASLSMSSSLSLSCPLYFFGLCMCNGMVITELCRVDETAFSPCSRPGWLGTGCGAIVVPDAVGADVDVAVDAGVVLCTAPPRELWGPPGQSLVSFRK